MLLLLFSFTCINALTFYIPDGKERCFLDEYPINTFVFGTHQLLDKPLPSGGSIELRVLDPENAVVLSKNTGAEEAKFTFTTKKGTLPTSS